MFTKTALIIDYGIGNLVSVVRACEKVGLHVKISHSKEEIEDADALILPGVGAFPEAMNNLEKLDIISSIVDFSNRGGYVLGVCLGMQLLMTQSEENGITKGLGIIEGNCLRFPHYNENGDFFKVPHMGWNSIHNTVGPFPIDTPLNNITNNECMYFVHSYFVQALHKSNILSYTKYAGMEYVSSVRKNNVFGFQFHPEKSGENGLKIYESFKNLINNTK